MNTRYLFFDIAFISNIITLTLIPMFSTGSYPLDFIISRGTITYRFIRIDVGVVLLHKKRTVDSRYVLLFLVPLIMLIESIKKF